MCCAYYVISCCLLSLPHQVEGTLDVWLQPRVRDECDVGVWVKHFDPTGGGERLLQEVLRRLHLQAVREEHYPLESSPRGGETSGRHSQEPVTTGRIP